jgi:Fe/S biogenesis protein NfuA
MLTFSDRAREVVRSYLTESGGELTALRIASQPGSPVAPRFELSLVADDERSDDERQLEGPGFAVFVKEGDVARLEGATIDFVDRVNESGFEVRTVAPPVSGPGAPEGEIADRVRQVLETQVNPAIAAHGGMISLVDVKDTEVFVEMSGGCQGCALSRMTLSQGVERMLRQSVPELSAVHDVTDHDSGMNPYFQH